MIWRCGGFRFDTSKPVIMGILNLTPDSFTDGGMFATEAAALARAEEMLEQGASLIDVGGESTRPGAAPVDPDEEWERIGGVVEALAARGVCVSVDTRHASVARRAVAAGASVVNDVSGFRDPAMVEVAAGSEVGCVVMHMRGEPQTMQDDPVYADVVAEVRDYLRERCTTLEAAGIARDRLCVDPGPGFGKTPKQTIELMRNLHELVHVGYPVLAAPSRKSYVRYAYRLEDPREQAAGPGEAELPEAYHALDVASAAEALLACELGAGVVRMHNVALAAQTLADLRPYVLLGMGSNVALVAEPGEETEAKIAQINLAIGQLCTLPDSQLIDIAGFYGSEPAYFEDQDAFVNTVVLLRTGVPPLELLGYLHAIENSLGRVRQRENGPRTIDIDILDYQMYVCESAELTLPHPRVAERDFVVKPLTEILPHHVLADGTAVDSVPESGRIGRAWRL